MSQTNWLNLLPDIYNKKVLKIGTQKIGNIIAIAYFNPESLTCVGSNVIKTKNLSIKYYQKIDDLPPTAFDVIIFDEPKYLTSFDSFSSIKGLLIKASQILKDEGILLLCFPENPMLSLKYRYWIKKIFPYTAFSCSNFFFCDPSAEYPSLIIPYAKKTRCMAGTFPNIQDRAFATVQRIKNMFKNIILRTTKIYYPFGGLILIAGKSIQGITNNETLLEISRTIPLGQSWHERNSKNLFMTFMAKKAKHIVFIHDPITLELRSVVKIGIPSANHMGRVREEHQSLQVLSYCKSLLEKGHITIPAPLAFVSSAQKEIGVQSVVPGTASDWMIRQFIRRKQRNAVLNVLDELTNIQIHLQETCTRRITNFTRYIDKAYFVNYLNLPLDCKTDDIALQTNDIQHGDFTLINIYRDSRASKWGILDWEWMARGYPPLFDLFSLSTSIPFKESRNTHDNELDNSYLSFIDTYFYKSWFSNHLRSIVSSYCDYFHYDKQFIFSYFIAHLLLQCNKYRLFYNSPKYQQLFEKMLRYSIRHKGEFALS
jgi:hypothetical protein